MSKDGRRGLGRGLSAIFEGDDQRTEEWSDLDSRLISIGLDALTSSVELDLCGYLSHAGEPNAGLTLAAPDLAMLDAGETYRLFASVSRSEFLPSGVHPLVLTRGFGKAVVSEGETRGVFVFGGENLSNEDADQAATFCESFGPLIQSYRLTPTAQERAELEVDQQSDGTHAEVKVRGSVGFGSAAEPSHAIARAVLSAISDRAKLVSVTEVRAQDGTAALVAVNGEDNPVGMGAALVDSGLHHAIAVATIRAAAAL